MSKCKRNILLIFGFLLLVIVFFVPYKHDYYAYISPVISEKEEGYIFLPLFIKNIIKYSKLANKTEGYGIGINAKVEEEEEKKEIDTFKEKQITKRTFISRYYYVNIDLFITELAIILFALTFGYILFCVVLKKSKKRRGK